jgi:DeoR family transcriptional regulator, glycerol-3-phosphate regulon repressor|tara:strand:- start:1598 stop:2359 length:762 start_codon:yes stop_codon:yes gene_type:complete
MTLKANDRRLLIAEHIAGAGEVTVDALSGLFDVSPETIRRDLTRLDASGDLRKVHGGARPVRLHTENSFYERMSEDAQAKHSIAKKLFSEVHEGDTLFVDTGSTTLIACAALCKIPGLTVITNSVQNAQVMADACNQHRVFLLGGVFSSEASQTTGALVLEQIDRFQADHAVLTCVGMDIAAGVTNANCHEAEVARAMIKRSENIIFLCPTSKIGRRAAHRVCEINDVGAVLTERPVNTEFHDALFSAGVRLP